MKQTSVGKTILSFVVRVVFSGGLLWYVLSRIDIEKTVGLLRASDIRFVLLSGAAFFFINIILLVRWLVFIRALGLIVAPWTAARYYFIGLFGNLFLPSSIGGDIIKILGLCRETARKPRVVASVLLDRLSGFAAIAIVSVCAFIVGYRYINDIRLAFPVMLLAVGVGVTAVVLFNQKVYHFCCQLFNAFPVFKKRLVEMHEDIMLLHAKPAEGYKAIGLSCLAQMTYAVTFYINAKALYQDIPLIYFLIFVPLVCVAASIPSIGGLGVREAGAAYFFSYVGIDAGIAVSLSLLSFLFMVTAGLIGGGVYVCTVSSRRVQHHPPDACAS